MIIEAQVFFCEVEDIESLIRKHYNVRYEIVAAEELSNGSMVDVTTSDDKLDEYDAEDLEKLLSGKFIQYRTYLWVKKLVMDGFLKPGRYIIKAWW